MRILIVSRAFHPQVTPRSFRTTELATELVRQGHEVTVAIPVDSDESRLYCQSHCIQLNDLGKPKWREMQIKGSGVVRLLRRGVRRGGDLLFTYPGIEIAFQIKSKLKKLSGYDLAITIAYPHAVHWGFRWLLSRNRNLCRTWIADCGDPFMGNTIDTFRPPFYFKYLEKGFCRRADFITVPVEGAVEAYYPEFRSKIHVVPQGFRFPESEFWPVYQQNPVPTFAFAGGFIPGMRDPRPILEFLTTISSPFKLICYTKGSELIQPFSDRLGDRLEVRNYIPREQLLIELAKMDFLLNIENRTARMSPSKLIDYALTGRPILSLDAFNIDSKNLHRFLMGNYSGRLEIEDLQRYNIENVARRFVELAEQPNRSS